MREVNLSRGMVALIDNEDWNAISAHRWRARPVTPAKRNWYAITRIDGKTVYMHRLITEAQKTEEIDHANANGLDNRRHNLRRCNRTQNNANIRRPLSRSGFLGVDTHPQASRTKRFRGKIQFHGQRIAGPWRETAVVAANDRDQLAAEYFGEFAVLNQARTA